jgi:hypothetical protein
LTQLLSPKSPTLAMCQAISFSELLLEAGMKVFPLTVFLSCSWSCDNGGGIVAP